jgi:hypothetical protein
MEKHVVGAECDAAQASTSVARDETDDNCHVSAADGATEVVAQASDIELGAYGSPCGPLGTNSVQYSQLQARPSEEQVPQIYLAHGQVMDTHPSGGSSPAQTSQAYGRLVQSNPSNDQLIQTRQYPVPAHLGSEQPVHGQTPVRIYAAYGQRPPSETSLEQEHPKVPPVTSFIYMG